MAMTSMALQVAASSRALPNLGHGSSLSRKAFTGKAVGLQGKVTAGEKMKS